MACPMRSVASSGAKDRSSHAAPSSFAAATVDTAAVVTRIAVSGAIAIRAGLMQHRQDLISSRQCLRHPAEMLIDLLLDRRINADFGGQIGNDTN